MQTYDDKKSEMNMLELLKQQVVSGLIMCSVEGDPATIQSYQEFGQLFCVMKRCAEVWYRRLLQIKKAPFMML